ncbi:MAG: LptE family protein [Candidatus Firestonebacteria bacterium]
MFKNRIKTYITFFTSFVFFTAFFGCATMKPNLPLSIKSITIPTFSNSTLQYGIETTLTDYVIKQFLMDGRLHIVGQEQADALLEGTIRKYLLEPLTYDVNNVIIQYRIKIVLDVKFTDLKENKVLWEQKEMGGITGGRTTFNVSGSNIETETEARQRIFKELSEDIVNRVVYGWENY